MPDSVYKVIELIGTSPESIDLAEDRRRFGELLTSLGIPQPENGSAMWGLKACRRFFPAEDPCQRMTVGLATVNETAVSWDTAQFC